MPTQTESLFQKAVDLGASDIHIAVGSPVQFRIDGNLVPQSKSDVTADDAENLVKSVLKNGEYERFQKEKEIDASFQLAGGERLRINCCYERGNVTLVARIVPPHDSDARTGRARRARRTVLEFSLMASSSSRAPRAPANRHRSRRCCIS
jgi:Tfp pilus assembly pilus retraction ATPase PilT